MLFSRWNWIDVQEFRKTFGFEDFNTYQDHLIFKAVRYGCERVDLESGGTITGILAEKPFPGHLTKTQEEAVKEAVAWCANHMIRQGLEWLRGNQAVSLGSLGYSINHRLCLYSAVFVVVHADPVWTSKLFQASHAIWRNVQHPPFAVGLTYL
jgi:hypothetical protein